MTTQDRSILDGFLTGHSNMIAFEKSDYISEQILPVKTVKQTTGIVPGYGNNHLRISKTAHVGKGEYRLLDTENYESDTYNISDHGIKEIVTKRAKDNSNKPYDALIDATDFLTSVQMTVKEKGLADTLTSTSIITQNTTLTGTQQYNNRSNADSKPIENRAAAISAIRATSGMVANTAIMSWEVMEALRYHEAFLDTLGFKDFKPGGLSYGDVARALSVEKVLVGKAMYNDSVQGQSDSLKPIWGKDLIYAYVADSLKLKQKTLGMEIRTNGTSPREIRRRDVDEPVGATKVICTDNYDQLLSNVECAYLIKDAIA